MTDKNSDDFVPDGEAGGDGPEEPLFVVPDDPAALDVDSPVEAPAEGSAAERAAASGPLEGDVPDLAALVAERTGDLQRLQAEYVNYKRRVDRDRATARTAGIEAVIADLLPVLDSIEAAREHEELTGGFKLVADDLEKLAAKYGVVVYGEPGDAFDPHLHEALMHMPHPDPIEVTTVSAVMQKGVKLNDRVIRPARVAVADPD